MKFSVKVGSGPMKMSKFWWQSGSPSGYRDCFPDLSLLGDTESGYQPTVLHDAAVQGKH